MDFAYQIHTDIGNHCSGAKVNGKIAPLNHSLKSGDMVEIITQKNKNPSEAWLSFVHTGAARNHIRAALRHSAPALAKKEPQVTEFRLAVSDRVGLLSEITDIISRSHVNIHSVNAKLPAIKIDCGILTKDKAEKIIAKLKKIKEVKEVGYRFA